MNLLCKGLSSQDSSQPVSVVAIATALPGLQWTHATDEADTEGKCTTWQGETEREIVPFDKERRKSEVSGNMAASKLLDWHH